MFIRSKPWNLYTVLEELLMNSENGGVQSILFFLRSERNKVSSILRAVSYSLFQVVPVEPAFLQLIGWHLELTAWPLGLIGSHPGWGMA